MHGVRAGEVIDDEPSVVVDLGAFAVLHKARVLRRAVGLGVDEQERVLRVGGQVVLALQPVGDVVLIQRLQRPDVQFSVRQLRHGVAVPERGVAFGVAVVHQPVGGGVQPLVGEIRVFDLLPDSVDGADREAACQHHTQQLPRAGQAEVLGFQLHRHDRNGHRHVHEPEVEVILVEVGVGDAADRQHGDEQQHKQLVVRLQLFQPQQQPHDAEEHPPAQQQTDARRHAAEVEDAGAVLVAELMEEVHQDAVQREPVLVAVPDDEAVGLEIIQPRHDAVADEIPRRAGHRRDKRRRKQPHLTAAVLQGRFPVGRAAVMQCKHQQDRRGNAERRVEHHELLDAVHARDGRNDAGREPLQCAVLFVGVEAAQHQRQHKHIKEGIDEVVPAVDGVDQIVLAERPQQRAHHPEAGPPEPGAFDKEQHTRRVQSQRNGHAERARQMPVIREKQQPQPVEPLQVDDLQFRGVEPVVADDAALFVEQVGEDHLRREVGIDDPFAGHKLVPQVKQIRRRHPEPRQRLPEPVQSPALCLLFHSVSPDSGF